MMKSMEEDMREALQVAFERANWTYMDARARALEVMFEDQIVCVLSETDLADNPKTGDGLLKGIIRNTCAESTTGCVRFDSASMPAGGLQLSQVALKIVMASLVYPPNAVLHACCANVSSDELVLCAMFALYCQLDVSVIAAVVASIERRSAMSVSTAVHALSILRSLVDVEAHSRYGAVLAILRFYCIDVFKAHDSEIFSQVEYLRALHIDDVNDIVSSLGQPYYVGSVKIDAPTLEPVIFKRYSITLSVSPDATSSPDLRYPYELEVSIRPGVTNCPRCFDYTHTNTTLLAEPPKNKYFISNTGVIVSLDSLARPFTNIFEHPVQRQFDFLAAWLGGSDTTNIYELMHIYKSTKLTDTTTDANSNKNLNPDSTWRTSVSWQALVQFAVLIILRGIDDPECEAFQFLDRDDLQNLLEHPYHSGSNSRRSAGLAKRFDSFTNTFTPKALPSGALAQPDLVSPFSLRASSANSSTRDEFVAQVDETCFSETRMLQRLLQWMFMPMKASGMTMETNEDYVSRRLEARRLLKEYILPNVSKYDDKNQAIQKFFKWMRSEPQLGAACEKYLDPEFSDMVLRWLQKMTKRQQVRFLVSP